MVGHGGELLVGEMTPLAILRRARFDEGPPVRMSRCRFPILGGYSYDASLRIFCQ